MACAAHEADYDALKPYSRDYYAAHACEHAVWDLQDRLDAIVDNDQVQNLDLGNANGTIEPYQDEIVPLDQKACQNDSRTADNKQTDLNQNVEIVYLMNRKTDLEDAIGDLSGMVMGDLKDKIDGYSMIPDAGDDETLTNIGFKQRLAKQTRHEQAQKARITEIAARLISVIDDKIPELKRKDAENQASYDNVITTIQDNTTTMDF